MQDAQTFGMNKLKKDVQMNRLANLAGIKTTAAQPFPEHPADE